jgi:hypothetical protein
VRLPQLASRNPVPVNVRRTLICAVALLALAALVARAVLVEDARAITRIAPLAAETPVRAWAGIAVLSVQQSDGAYRLATQHGREAPRLLPGIAAASYPFDANIGPGPNGSPLIVFARCAKPPAQGRYGEPLPRRCTLMRTSSAGTSAGTGATPIASAAGRDAHAPAIWGNRLVFAQPAARGADWIYVVSLAAGTHIRPVRFRSAPRFKCEETGSPCYAATVHPTVTELSIRGRWLGEDINVGTVENSEICARTEVRLVDLAHHRSDRLASPVCREGGSTLLGVSFTRTHFFFTSECGGTDQNICQYTKTLVYRYGVRDHRLEAAPEHDLVTGFAALDDDHAVEIAAPTRYIRSESPSELDCTRESRDTHEALRETSPLCELVRVGPIRFSRRAVGLRE